MAKLSHRAKQTFGSLQTTWSIVGITLILLLLVEGSFRLILAVRDHFAPVAVPDHRVITEGYGGALWPIVHYREIEQLQELWHPYVLFRQKPFRGETITIGPDGARRPGNLRMPEEEHRPLASRSKKYSLWEARPSGASVPVTTTPFLPCWHVCLIKKVGESS